MLSKLLFRIVLHFTKQNCSGPITLGRAVSCRLLRSSPKSFGHCLTLLNGDSFRWNIKRSTPDSSSYYRESPARVQTYATDSSTLPKEDNRFLGTCPSLPFIAPAEFCPPLYTPQNQPLRHFKIGTNWKDWHRTEQHLIWARCWRIYESNHETPYKCLCRPSGDMTFVIWHCEACLSSTARISSAMFVTLFYILFNLALTTRAWYYLSGGGKPAPP